MMYSTATMILIYITAFLLPMLWLIYKLSKRNPLSHIPGPNGIPIFGNLFQLDPTRVHVQLAELAKQYGSVFALNLAGKHVLVVTGKDSLYEVLLKRGNDFAGRVQTFRTKQFDATLVMSDPTPLLQHQKKLIMNHMKGYGSALQQLEEVIVAEIGKLVETLKQKSNGGQEVLNFHEYLSDCITNISCILCFGHDIPDDDKAEIFELIDCFNIVFQSGMIGEALDMFPFLRHFGHPYWKAIGRLSQIISSLYEKWKDKIIKDRKSGKDMSANFLHRYLEIFEGDNKLGITEDHLSMSICISVFGAAINTTNGTLRTLMANVILNPPVQEKLYKENSEHLGSRTVSLKDRSNMPYHYACIYETIRLCPIAPMTMPHLSLCATQVSGYSVPKGTAIFPNIWSLQHDENLWEKPMEFVPERYLDHTGHLVPADHPSRVNTLTFGMGPRVCPGETMAMTRMFLILATMIQKFELLPATTLNEQPRCGPLDMIAGTIMQPPTYHARISPRV